MAELLPIHNYSFLAGLASASPAIATHSIAMLAARSIPLAPKTFSLLGENSGTVIDAGARSVLDSISSLGSKGGSSLLTAESASELLTNMSALSDQGAKELSRVAIDAIDAGAQVLCGSFDRVWATAAARLGTGIVYQLPTFAEDESAIPEVLQIPKDGTIPPALLERYGSKRIAESVVARMGRRRLQSEGDLKADFRRSRIKIYFGGDEISDVLKNGILNIHQTNTGEFAYRSGYLGHRTAFENAVAELQISDPRIRPKYGMIEVYEPSIFAVFGEAGNLRGNNYEDNHFGDVTAVLKDGVKRRTTFTLFDSLNILYDEKSSSVVGEKECRSGMRVFEDGPSRFGEMEFDFQYMEAQVWGEVGLEDIEYFIIGDYYFMEDADAMIAKMTGLLKAAGIPIFKKMDSETPMTDFFPEGAIADLLEGGEAQAVMEQGMWIPGETLYAGDWRKMLALEERR